MTDISNVPVNPAAAIMDLEQALAWRNAKRVEGKQLVITNGCFDILHRGHAQYLYESRCFGDIQLVLINSDRSVRELKGSSRPIVSEYDRAYLLASLSSVDAVVIFDSQICAKELRALAPDVYVKGGDYNVEKLNPVERAALLDCKAEFHFIPFVENFSTTGMLEKIKKAT